MAANGFIMKYKIGSIIIANDMSFGIIKNNKNNYVTVKWHRPERIWYIIYKFDELKCFNWEFYENKT